MVLLTKNIARDHRGDHLYAIIIRPTLFKKKKIIQSRILNSENQMLMERPMFKYYTRFQQKINSSKTNSKPNQDSTINS